MWYPCGVRGTQQGLTLLSPLTFHSALGVYDLLLQGLELLGPQIPKLWCFGCPILCSKPPPKLRFQPPFQLIDLEPRQGGLEGSSQFHAHQQGVSAWRSHAHQQGVSPWRSHF